MEFESREATYLRDSQRVRPPLETVEDLESQLEELFDMEGMWRDALPSSTFQSYILHNNDYEMYWYGRKRSRGKGITLEQSKASAYSEYIERFVASEYIRNYESREPENPAISMEELLPSRDAVGDHNNQIAGLYDRGSSQRWSSYYSLKRGKHVDLPFLTHTFTTNGLASGNVREEAVLHGIFETVERDETFRQLPRVDPENLDDNKFVDPGDVPDEIADRFEELDKLLILYSRSELCPPVHVFQVIAFVEPVEDPKYPPKVEVIIGKGANLDPEYGLQRALTETFQAIAGRNTCTVKCPFTAEGTARLLDHSYSPEYIDFGELEDNFDTDLRKNIELCVEELDSASDIYVKELEHPDIDFSVVKVYLKNSFSGSTPSLEPELFEEVLDHDLTPLERAKVMRSNAIV